MQLGHSVHVVAAEAVYQLAQQASGGGGRVANQAGDAQGGELRGGGRGGGVASCAIGGGEHGGVGVDQRLQVRCSAGGAGGQDGQGAVDGADVVAAHAGEACSAVVGGPGGGVGPVVLGQGVERLGFGHKSLQLGHGVDRRAVIGAGAQQGLHGAQVACGEAGDAQRAQLRQRNACARPCGCGQHGGVGVDHGLQLSRAAGRAGGQGGQGAVDGVQVGAAHAAHTGGGVVGQGGRVVGTGVGAE